VLSPWVLQLPAPPGTSWRRTPAPARMHAGARQLLLAQAWAWRALDLKSLPACPFMRLEDFEQDRRGAPISRSGWHWSVSHSSGWCAALLSPRGPLGLDVEEGNRRLSAPLIERLTRLMPPQAVPRDGSAWLEAWVRLEAALKLSGEGLGLLAKIAAEAPDSQGRQRWYWPGGSALTRATRLGPLVLAAACPDDFTLEPHTAPDPWLQLPPS
jgi:phosphopantetheinyl transferase